MVAVSVMVVVVERQASTHNGSAEDLPPSGFSLPAMPELEASNDIA